MKILTLSIIVAASSLSIACSGASPDASSDPSAGGADQNAQTSGGNSSSSGDDSNGGGSASSNGGGATSGGGNGTSGGDGSQATKGGQLFGTHTQKYAPGAIAPSGGQAALDVATASFYDAWKAKYLVKDCGGYYVATTLDGNSGGGQASDAITVSEAHGYGMLLAALMAGHDPDAHAIYDGLYAFFRAHPSRNSPDLMAWQQVTGCKSSSDSDSATDGDLDIAYSLLLAADLWPGGAIDYAGEAKKVIAAAMAHEVNATTHLTLLGDWSTKGDKYFFGTRPSDFMTDHFRAFGAATGDAGWTQSVDAIYTLVSTMQTTHAPKTGLVSDFVVSTDTNAPSPAPSKYLEDTTDGDYAYNACRVPWRLGTDALMNGEPRAKAQLAQINAWVRSKTGEDASNIGTDYTLGGTSTTPSDSSMAFVAPFGVAAMIDAKNQAWLDAIWMAVVAQSLDDEGDYFGNTVKLLSMIVMSQNWWTP
jgi:endo-1,4-beta-D-glucanase Y